MGAFYVLEGLDHWVVHVEGTAQQEHAVGPQRPHRRASQIAVQQSASPFLPQQLRLMAQINR